MLGVHSVAQVRAAEAALMARLPEGALMQRAAAGLAAACVDLLAGSGRGGGSRVALLIGSGNNGGDALWAGARLARRGVRVDALLLADHWHEAGAQALRRAGGILHAWPEGASAVDAADLVIDGVLGIGGRGALRGDAADAADMAQDSGATVVAVDVPSGVDADTGAVAGQAVRADVTVTFGCLKPGLVLDPGRSYAGDVVIVDIGLVPDLAEVSDGEPRVGVMEGPDLAAWIRAPRDDDYKYSRGVVGIAAGSDRFRGAAFMATGAARHTSVGMVHILDRGDGVARGVVEHFWDVVASADAPREAARVTAWAVGPGLGLDHAAAAALAAVLATDVPVVVDADALHLLAAPAGRAALAARTAPTVLTPHVGEFTALGYTIGSGGRADRMGIARRAAGDLGAIIVLKGPGTVVAAPDGSAVIDVHGGPELGTAGSGDVLTGIVAGVLAGNAHRLVSDAHTAAAVGAAVGLHGLAGTQARANGPVTAPDLIAALPGVIEQLWMEAQA